MKGCEAGCKSFTGGELKHHPDCRYYKGSMSEQLDSYILNTINKSIPMKISFIDTAILFKMWNFAFGKRKNADYHGDVAAKNRWDTVYHMIDKELEKRVLEITE